MSGRTLGGPNSGPRVGPVVVSELMYNPPGSDADPALDSREFVEIYNPTGQTVNLTHWTLAGGVSFSFAADTLLQSHEALVILPFDPATPANAAKLADFRTAYGIDQSVRLVGGYQGSLSNGGETVRLTRPDGPPLGEPTFYPPLLEDEVNYDDAFPWPTAADGQGSSLARLTPTGWGNDWASWRAEAPSPGTAAFDRPTAGDDSASIPQDTSATIDLLANDATPSGTLNPASVTVVAPPAHGRVMINPQDGVAIYTPTALWSGSDSFRYTVANDRGLVSNEAIATITVIDTVAPTVDVVDVSPDPRTSAVSTVSIVFSEPVYGFDLADLRLTRNGTNVALTAATLTTADNMTWTLGNLGGLTGTIVAGTTTNYALTLTAAGSGITDVAGNALAADATDAWQLQPTSFTGTPNADTFEFIAAGAVGGLPTMHQLKLTLAGSPVVTYLYDASGSVALTLRGGGGNDTLRITGGPGMDTSSIYRYAILHVGPAAAGSAGYYSVYAPYADGSFETMAVDGGAGTGQRATLYNGPASGDHFTAWSWLRTGSMVGTGTGNVYNNSVKNFD